MFLIRNAMSKDLNAIHSLAQTLNSYNLPADRKFLRGFLNDVERSFQGRLHSFESRKYLFLAEEIPTGKIAGCSLIIAKHGTPKDPHLAFRVGEEVRESQSLGKKIKHRCLELVIDKNGPTELGGLVVLPRYRKLPQKIGRQLSWVRFLYIAAHPERFQKRFLAEYLPPFPKPGYSPLWESVGKKFTGLSYQAADRLSARNKEFILALFPREKIYFDFLPRDAQQLIGKLGEGAKRAASLLERIGFRYLQEVDLFDGGPHYGARWNEVRLFRQIRKTSLNQVRLHRAFIFHEPKPGTIEAGLIPEVLQQIETKGENQVLCVEFPP